VSEVDDREPRRRALQSPERFLGAGEHEYAEPAATESGMDGVA
jgi:hypothetical protein